MPRKYTDTTNRKYENDMKNLRIVLIASVFIFSVILIAWVKEGYRLSGYDTKAQMEAAEIGGFSDKETFLAAKKAEISTAEEWKRFLADMQKAGFGEPEDFLTARKLGISTLKEWTDFNSSMAKAGFDNPKDYKEFRGSSFQSKVEFYEARRLGASNRIQLLGKLADEKFQDIEIGSDEFISFCSMYIAKAYEITKQKYGDNNEDVKVALGILTIMMMRYGGNWEWAFSGNSDRAKELEVWMNMGEESAVAGFEDVLDNVLKTGSLSGSFKKCMENSPPVSNQIMEKIMERL